MYSHHQALNSDNNLNQNLSSWKLKTGELSINLGLLVNISLIYFLFMSFPSVFSLSLPSNRAAHTAPHTSVILLEGTWNFHICAYKNKTFSYRQYHTLAKPTATSQSLACISNLHVSADYCNNCDNCAPTPTHAHTQTVLAQHTSKHIHVIRHASLLLWWVTFGDSGSEHPLPGLISHCHKSIRECGRFNVFISLLSFGAIGLTSSLLDR